MTTIAPDKSPKFRRRAAERPDEVLDAALALFSAQGFARTTVAEVGQRAGLSKAAVYLYFPSKQALLKALVHRAVSALADEAVERMQAWQGDPRPVLALLLRTVARHMAAPEVAAIPALILREAPHAPEIAALYREEVLDRVMPALTRLIAQGVAGGHIRTVDPDLTVRSVLGPVLLHVALARVFGITPPGGLGLDRLVENHITILNAGLAPEPSQGDRT
jgi:AcrR family transcriptional regulator